MNTYLAGLVARGVDSVVQFITINDHSLSSVTSLNQTETADFSLSCIICFWKIISLEI